MSTSTPVSSELSNDLSLYGLFYLLISKWLIITISGLSFALVTLFWVINQSDIYEAEILLMPADSASGGLGGLAGKFGGLASLAGVSLPEGGKDNTLLAMELIKSRSFIGKFIKKHNILVPLMAATSWNRDTNTLILDDNVYDTTNKLWVRAAKPPRGKEPSLQEAFEKFKKLIKVEQDPKTKFVTMSIEYYSPEIAALWLTDIVSMLNNEIREIDKKEANESIFYLEDIIKKSKISELKKVFSGLMEEQLKSKMLAEVRKDYVFKVIDPAVVPEMKSKPQRALIIILGGFLGGILGIIIALYQSGRQTRQVAFK